MQVPKSVIAIMLTGLLTAACGGNAATQGPDGPGVTPDNGGQATQDPGLGATPGGGNGGNGGGQYGSVKFKISGPFDKSGEYPFIPVASIFGGSAGVVLNFGDDSDTSSIVSILISEAGTVVVSYAGSEGQVPGAECTTSNWNIGAQSGSGTFDCTAAFSITGSGATVEGGKITGEFTART